MSCQSNSTDHTEISTGLETTSTDQQIIQRYPQINRSYRDIHRSTDHTEISTDQQIIQRYPQINRSYRDIHRSTDHTEISTDQQIIQRYPQINRSYSYKLHSHEHCEANYLGPLEIIHFENIVGTRSSRRRISGVDSRGSTPGGGFGKNALSQFASYCRGNAKRAG